MRAVVLKPGLGVHFQLYSATTSARVHRVLGKRLAQLCHRVLPDKFALR